MQEVNIKGSLLQEPGISYEAVQIVLILVHRLQYPNRKAAQA